jgi:hypothetical protein
VWQTNIQDESTRVPVIVIFPQICGLLKHGIMQVLGTHTLALEVVASMTLNKENLIIKTKLVHYIKLTTMK